MLCYIDGSWQPRRLLAFGETHETSLRRSAGCPTPFLRGGRSRGVAEAISPVFTTAFVHEGAWLFMREHIARLTSDAQAIGFDAPSRARIRAVVEEGIGRNRMTEGVVKIIVAPGLMSRRVARASLSVLFEPPRPAPRGVRLLSLETVPTSWSAHKVLARAELAALHHKAVQAGCFDALLSDENDILETTIANAFVVKCGVVMTPKADGRILPGIARQKLLANRELGIREHRVRLADLQACDGVFITNCVRGLMPVSSVRRQDGSVVWRSHGPRTWIAPLRRAWEQIVAAQIARNP